MSILKNTIDLRIPKAWEELTDKEARIIFGILATANADQAQARLRALLAINSIKVVARSAGADDRWLCRSRRTGLFELDGLTAARISAPLEFIHRPAAHPWRPGSFGSASPISAELYELTLGDWFVVFNTLQGVIVTEDYSLLDSLRPMLMKKKPLQVISSRRRAGFSPADRMALFFWILSYRDHMAHRYPELFRRAGADDDAPAAITSDMLRESIDAQLRALTMGDVTKEEAVMALPIDRAFAELNAKAREYREIKEKQST